MTRSQSTPPRTSERTYGGSSPISYFSRPRSRYSDQSMLRHIRYDWGNTSNAFQRQSNTRERRLYFQNNSSREGAFDVSYNRSVYIDTVTSKVFQEIMYFQYESFAKSNVGIVYWQSSRFSSNWKTSFANKKRHSKRYDVAIQ